MAKKSEEVHTRPDFDGEWCKTWLRLHPERINHLAMGSTAFDMPEDTKTLSMAEQWLYAPTGASASRDKRRSTRRRHRQPHQGASRSHENLFKSATLDGSGRPLGKRLEGNSDSETFSEEEEVRVGVRGSLAIPQSREHRYQRAEKPRDEDRRYRHPTSKNLSRGNTSSESDEFLVTASDPELSSLRFAPPSPRERKQQKKKTPTTSATSKAAGKGQQTMLASPSGRTRRASLVEATPSDHVMRRLEAKFDVDDEELDYDLEAEGDSLEGEGQEIEIVKPGRHKLRRKSSLDRVSWTFTNLSGEAF